MATPALAQVPPGPYAGPGDTAQSPTTSRRVTDRSSFTGTWERYTRGDPAPPSAPPTPPPGRPPLKPQYLAELDALQAAEREAAARFEPVAGGAVDCMPEGFPGMMGATFPIEFLVEKGQVTILEEAFRQVRRIYIDETQGTPGDVEPVWYGHSVGKWEGDTLVVDTIGVKEEVRFRQTPHSDRMRVTERMKMLSPDFMQIEFTIEDPAYLTEPWKFTWVYRRLPGYKIQEYVCEANRVYRDDAGATRIQIAP